MTKKGMWKDVILSGCLILLGLDDPAWAQGTSSTAKAWQRWEQALTATDTNLTPLEMYRNVQVEVTFWLKNGTSCGTTPAACSNPDTCFKGMAFWDGVQGEMFNFKIRSAFPFGTWCWTTCHKGAAGSCLTSAGLTRTQPAEIAVSKNDTQNPLYSNGFLKAPKGKRNLATWNGQTTFFWIGDTAWDAPINYSSNRTLWARYINQRSTQYLNTPPPDGDSTGDESPKGFTNVMVAPAVQTVVPPPSPGGLFRGFLLSPTPAPPSIDCTTPDVRVFPRQCHYWDSVYWRDFDAMIKVANDKGIVMVVADLIDPLNRAGTNQSSIKPAIPFPARADMIPFARNLAARLAGSFVVFSPSYDARAADPTIETGINVANLIDEVGKAIRSAAPRHLVGVHLAGGSPPTDYDKFHPMPWFSLQLFQSGHKGGTCESGVADAYANFSCRARKFALRFRCIGDSSNPTCAGSGALTNLAIKPAVNVEGQYETIGNQETRVQTRHTAWNTVLSGSFGFNIGVYPDLTAWTNPTVYNASNHYSDEDLGRIKGFFKSLPWSSLTPRHDLLVEQNNFPGTTCTHAIYGTLSKTDWLQFWKPHLALDAAAGFGLAYLPRPLSCEIPSPSGSNSTTYSASTSIVLDRAKATALGIACDTWTGTWFSPAPGNSGGFSSKPTSCSIRSDGNIMFAMKSGFFIPCGANCDRVLHLTKKPSASQNSPNLVKSASTVDLLCSIDLSEDGQTSRITGQILADGSPIGDPIPLSGPEPRFRKLPSAALDASGNFLVVWEEENEEGTDDIVAARFNPLLDPMGPVVVVNDTTEGQQAEPWASGDDSGETVVVWTHYSEDEGIAGDVYARVLDRFGQLVGSEILVSIDNVGNQSLPQVQMDGDGGFVVAWTSDPPVETLDVVPPDETADFSIARGAATVHEKQGGVYYRIFGADGRPRGPERRVHTSNPGQDRLSHLEVHRHGGFKIRWREYDSTGQDLGEREQDHDQNGNPIGRN